MTKDKKIQYWKKNLKYISWLLTFWFIISFGCGILLVNFLSTITIGGFKLGFWFAQQGAIFGFVIIIFIYIFLMNRLDKSFKS
jgi:putative solute:sodium symporter small subunit|tara:strand:- start:1528 stop:1776 length:249 start_codon:yes stop_codon:yes gene_type:complete